MHRKLSLLMLAALATACGDDFLPVEGTYTGTAELYNATNFGMVTNERDASVTITPSASSPDRALVGIDERCVFDASFDDTTVTITEQTCTWSAQRSMDSWTYEGSGAITNGRLELELTGTFTRTYTDNSGSPPLEGNHRFTFAGDRL